MTMRVVDLLEAVEVDKDNGRRLAGGDVVVQQMHELVLVVQARQRVLRGQPEQPAFPLAPLGNVLDDSAGAHALLAFPNRQRDFDRKFRPVLLQGENLDGLATEIGLLTRSHARQAGRMGAAHALRDDDGDRPAQHLVAVISKQRTGRGIDEFDVAIAIDGDQRQIGGFRESRSRHSAAAAGRRVSLHRFDIPTEIHRTLRQAF